VSAVHVHYGAWKLPDARYKEEQNGRVLLVDIIFTGHTAEQGPCHTICCSMT